MVFVPIVVPPTALSTRSRELSAKLEEAIETYQRQHPEVSRTEVSQALAAVRGARQASSPEARRTVAVLAATLVAGLGVFVALAANGGSLPSGSGTPVVAIAVGVGVILVAALLKLRRSSEE